MFYIHEFKIQQFVQIILQHWQNSALIMNDSNQLLTPEERTHDDEKWFMEIFYLLLTFSKIPFQFKDSGLLPLTFLSYFYYNSLNNRTQFLSNIGLNRSFVYKRCMDRISPNRLHDSFNKCDVNWKLTIMKWTDPNENHNACQKIMLCSRKIKNLITNLHQITICSCNLLDIQLAGIITPKYLM